MVDTGDGFHVETGSFARPLREETLAGRVPVGNGRSELARRQIVNVPVRVDQKPMWRAFVTDEHRLHPGDQVIECFARDVAMAGESVLVALPWGAAHAVIQEQGDRVRDLPEGHVVIRSPGCDRDLRVQPHDVSSVGGASVNSPCLPSDSLMIDRSTQVPIDRKLRKDRAGSQGVHPPTPAGPGGIASRAWVRAWVRRVTGRSGFRMRQKIGRMRQFGLYTPTPSRTKGVTSGTHEAATPSLFSVPLPSLERTPDHTTFPTQRSPQLTARTTLGHTNVVSMGTGGYKGGEYRGVWGEKRGDHSRGVDRGELNRSLSVLRGHVSWPITGRVEMATVQDYLNLAISGTISNQSKTDIEFQLPNDIRRLSDLKVASWEVTRSTIAAGGSAAFNVSGNTTSLFLLFFSHPVEIRKVENASVQFSASFFGVWTDRSDGTNSMDLGTTNSVEINNTLHSPNYVTTSGGATTAVEATKVEIALSSTA